MHGNGTLRNPSTTARSRAAGECGKVSHITAKIPGPAPRLLAASSRYQSLVRQGLRRRPIHGGAHMATTPTAARATSPQRRLLVVCVLVLSVLGCGSPSSPDATVIDSGVPPIGECGVDSDRDGIPDHFETTSDDDRDGTPSHLDDDSDNDGRPDRLEASANRAPYDCRIAPADSDGDRTPDFRDRDSDGNGILDVVELRGFGEPPARGWGIAPVDTDNDGTPDYADADDDNDTITDRVEVGADPSMPPDTDNDGRPDWRDTDSDGDTIADRIEVTSDFDFDGVPNFRDHDSDGDGADDALEARDPAAMVPRVDPNEFPFECPTEVDPSDFSVVRPDARANYVDADSDNDGLGDREERMIGSNVCRPDSDADGQLDVVEHAYCVQHRRTGCATDSVPSLRAQDYYLVLPFDGGPQQRELEFGTSIRVADVFFLFDTTDSMFEVLQAVASTIAQPSTGLVDAIRRIIPDAWFGTGHYDDFLSGRFGEGADRPIHPLCTMIGTGAGPTGFGPPECLSAGSGSLPYHGVIMTNPTAMIGRSTGAQVVQTVARGTARGNGNDRPESTVEALYQLVTNEGLFDRSAPSTCATPEFIGHPGCWVKPTVCPEGTWGFPCFRAQSLAVVIQFGDASWHNGARDEAPPTTTLHSPYEGITPAPHDIDQMMAAYRRRSARQIHINASATRCESRSWTNHALLGPCFDARIAAEGTGSVDFDGVPLVFDLPVNAGSGAPPSSLVEVVTNAVDMLATRVPIDVTTALRSDPANPRMLDARQFIKRRTPSCELAPRTSDCWTARAGAAHRTAVARTDASAFYRVIPGTRVRFTVTFENDLIEGPCRESLLFHAYIDVLGDGVTLLDTRDVFVIVPAAPSSSARCGNPG